MLESARAHSHDQTLATKTSLACKSIEHMNNVILNVDWIIFPIGQLLIDL